jgi:hypothetical protein
MSLLGAILVAPWSGWAEGAAPEDATVQSSSNGATVLAGVGAVAGSIVFAPFKAVIMCPAGALAAGVTYVAARGEGETPNYLLRLGCTGTYFISPAMVQGREAFRRYDEW